MKALDMKHRAGVSHDEIEDFTTRMDMVHAIKFHSKDELRLDRGEYCLDRASHGGH